MPFGGDEVIVGAAGCTHQAFLDSIAKLRSLLAMHTPRTCSFALASLEEQRLKGNPAMVYRQLVTSVDKALFDAKANRRLQGRRPAGEVADLGLVNLAVMPAMPMAAEGQA